MQSENNRTMYALTAELGGEWIDVLRFDDNSTIYYIWEEEPAVVADIENNTVFVDVLFYAYNRKAYNAIINHYEYNDYEIKFLSFK